MEASLFTNQIHIFKMFETLLSQVKCIARTITIQTDLRLYKCCFKENQVEKKNDNCKKYEKQIKPNH